MNIETIKKLEGKKGFSAIDIEFANFIVKLENCESYVLYISAALVSYMLRKSHICLDLNRLAGTKFPENETAKDEISIILPDFLEWSSSLLKFKQTISKNSNTPLILDTENRLYLHKYWHYEQILASEIKKRIKLNFDNIKILKKNRISEISKHFNSESIIDWQQIAVFASLVSNFLLITGGPGTGKTTVVSALLAIILELNSSLKIKICAPTGKAAGRLKESISDELQNLNITNEIKHIIANLETYTVHRLLGPKYLSPNFKHKSSNLIEADLIIIDEASMISLPLMSKLLSSLPLACKIIMLGDRSQLASVEAGAVLANIYDVGNSNKFTEEFIYKLKPCEDYNFYDLEKVSQDTPFSNIIVELTKSHRFDDKEGIGIVKNAINKADTIPIDQILTIAKKESSQFIMTNLPQPKHLEKKIISHIETLKVNVSGNEFYYKDYFFSKTPEAAYAIINEFKILCSHNVGPYGVNSINKIIENYLFGSSTIQKGVPIIIKNNSQTLSLYNGDTGIIWTDKAGKLKAFFPTIENDKIMRSFSINSLPDFDKVYAMTIHKSQGSGFQKILVLTSDSDSQLLTRELIYTAITRAKKQCNLWCNEDIFKASILRKTTRDSGLLSCLMS